MLAVVEVLKEYKNFLLGANNTIFTDHKHLLSNSTVNDRVFRWKQNIQEFRPILNYIKGHKNIDADALSRLPITDESIEVMLIHPPIDLYNPLLNKNPTDLAFIQHYQNQGQALLRALQEEKHFSKIYHWSLGLIHFQAQEHMPPKIVIPQALQHSTIRWLHSLLGHADITLLSATLRKKFGFQICKTSYPNLCRGANTVSDTINKLLNMDNYLLNK